MENKSEETSTIWPRGLRRTVFLRQPVARTRNIGTYTGIYIAFLLQAFLEQEMDREVQPRADLPGTFHLGCRLQRLQEYDMANRLDPRLLVLVQEHPSPSKHPWFDGRSGLKAVGVLL